jgi:HAD superfamily hydrolase (TIGR01509 family)
MSIQAVVFDFDGVLADSEPVHFRVYQELLAPSGVTLTMDAYCARYLGFDDEGAFRQMAADFNLLLGDEEIELLIEEKARRFERLVSGTNVLYPTAVPCVERLAARWPLGIASGALRADIDIMLKGARIADRFRFIVSAGDTDGTKPAPDPYLKAAELHGLPPSACVAIEDSHWGLQSARGAGMRTIAVTHTYPRESLADADQVVDSLDEITIILLDRL